MAKVLVPSEVIENKIFLIRGMKVMIDRDLAKLYGVPTGRLNEQVRRNTKRFPDDFMFQLTKEESGALISQFAISKDQGRGGHRKLSLVFTEQGVAMLSSVLNSDRAIEVNIAIMRAFVKLRELMTTHKDLAKKINDLERQYKDHDEKILMSFDAIRQLMTSPPKAAQEKDRLSR